MIVVQGQYTLLIDGKKTPLRADEEYFIPRGVLHGGEVLTGTTATHAFGGAPGGAGSRALGLVCGITLSSVQGSSTTAS
jgi:hypothetical protein